MTDEGRTHSRFRAEIQVLAGLSGLWTFFCAYALLWLAATRSVPLDGSVPWLEIGAVQVLALEVVGIGLLTDLPRSRWPRGPDHTSRTTTGWMILALPLWPIAAALAVRHRRAREIEPSSTTLEEAFAQLLRFPRSIGLRFFLSCATAWIIDGFILSQRLGWSRDEQIVVGLLGMAILAPLGSTLVGWSRRVLRPELLSAPRRKDPFVRRRGFRLRLIVNAVVASVGIIATPLCAAYLWTANTPSETTIERATELSEQAARLASTGADEDVGMLLVRHRGLAVRLGDRHYGPLYPVEGRRGPIDLDGDEVPDVVVAATPIAQAVVPIAEGGVPIRRTLLIGGLCALAFALINAALIAVDMHRDLVDATRLASDVARGRDLPAAHPRRYASFEIQALVSAMERLVDRITEANIAKYVAIERAKEADRLKSQFLANMSHDLRSPLNSIMGFSELLTAGIDGHLNPEQREMAATIHQNGRALLQQIDDILDTAKIDASRLDMHPEPTPPLTLINRAIHNAKKRQRGDIEYELDAAAGLPPAVVDPYRTVQALENILLFASERMESGTLRIQIRGGRNIRGRAIYIDVQTPIRPASKEQLSAAQRGFHRIPGHRGLGLGLPIAGSILELQGGSLRIEDLQEGMAFRAELGAPDLSHALSHGPRRRS